MKNQFKVTESRMEPMGVCFVEAGMHVAAALPAGENARTNTEFGIILYDRKHRDGLKVPFPKENRIGAVCSMLLKGYHDRNCRYLFYYGDRIFQDPYARAVEHTGKYGVPGEKMPKCRAAADEYEWNGDRPLNFSYAESIIYAIHVRGFTKHKSSGVSKKGTYAGILEKIPYLKELGITSLLLMPAYEFDEVLVNEAETPMSMEQAVATYKQPLSSPEKQEVYRVNYWGYQKGLYRVPKSAYAYSKDAVTEYKDMVRELHKCGIEVMMQFYFPPDIRSTEILEILKFWILEYHIDGFHLMGVDIPMAMLASEPLFADTKILIDQNCMTGAESSGKTGTARNLGMMNDSFMYDMRKLLKGDDNMIGSFLFHIRNNSTQTGIVNYIAKWDGMRLNDLVSYERKHNEANGEQNQDGTDYNCSWNCGVEGKSKRKSVIELRNRQMKNALALLLLSQGTPLIYGGDEFQNTQEGNNNPYCQDNAVAWVKWNMSKSGAELQDYTRSLIMLRKNHSILHREKPLSGTDFLSCGYPDISFHGKEAWSPDTTPASRCIGVMFCGYYGKENEREERMSIYIGVNMHWETHILGLPKLPRGKMWTLLLSTGANDRENMQCTFQATGVKQELLIPPRTVLLYVVKDCPVIESSDSGRAGKSQGHAGMTLTRCSRE